MSCEPAVRRNCSLDVAAWRREQASLSTAFFSVAILQHPNQLHLPFTLSASLPRDFLYNLERNSLFRFPSHAGSFGVRWQLIVLDTLPTVGVFIGVDTASRSSPDWCVLPLIRV